jgi:hypothetical protein
VFGIVPETAQWHTGPDRLGLGREQCLDAALIVSVFVLGDAQTFVTGIVSLYVGKCLKEAKRRPLYFVRETSNL